MNRSPDILRHLVRRFGVLVALTVLGAVAGAAYGVTKAPTYVAEAHVVVTAQPGEFPAAVNFAQAYGRIVTAGPVADEAAKALGSRADLDRVTASTSPDAPVIEIVAAGPDAARTATVANAVAKALVDFGTKRKDQTRVTLAVLAAAAVPTAPASPKPPLEAAIGAVAGCSSAAWRCSPGSAGRGRGECRVECRPRRDRRTRAAAGPARAADRVLRRGTELVGRVRVPAGPPGRCGRLSS